MKPIRLLHIAITLCSLFAILTNAQVAFAQTSADIGDTPTIIVRQLTYWEGSFVGYVDPQLYEKWPFALSQSEQFVVTAVPVTSGFVPVLILQDASGNELARGTGSFTTTRDAGEYSLLVQPETTGGFYQLTLRRLEAPTPTPTTEIPPTPTPTTEIPPTPTPTTETPPPAAGVISSVQPGMINVGDSAVVTVSLANVPAAGYASAEFTCTYDAATVEASNVVEAGLFGADAASAMNGPGSGSFILAIAGSNGNKAAAAGTAFTFSLKALQPGRSTVECKARVSTGDNSLVDVEFAGTSLTVEGTPPSNPMPDTPTPTEAPAGQSPTPTAPPVTAGSLVGQVNAGKPVTVSLFSGDTQVASVPANSDGSFSLTAPAGGYTALAFASGFLKAQGAVTLTDAQTTTLTAVTLLAGDIDGNNVIDQFDALTIGMNYNTAEPAAADLNNDGVINVLDLQLLARNYRASGALAWH